MNKYRVMFIEQSFSCNTFELRCTDGERRYMFHVEADNIKDAYHQAVKLVRERTNNLVRLNYCKRIDSMEV